MRSVLRLPWRRSTPTVDAMEHADERISPPGSRKRRIGLMLGPALFLLVLVTPPPADLGVAAWRTLAVALLMATWWVTEATPLPVTALVPIVAIPFLDVGVLGDVATPYASPIVFLFLGGFMIALTLERWNLHRRLALAMLSRVGTRPTAIVGGFMATAAALSMWVSNTATTLMMIPLAASVLLLMPEGPDRETLGTALVLGVAYGATIGGLGTLIGSPPNALLAGYLGEQHGIRVTFVQWMMLGVPLVLVGLPLAWMLLTRVAYRLPRRPLEDTARLVAEERAGLGPMSTAERRVLMVFAATAALWVFNPLLGRLTGLPFSDAAVGLMGAFALFLLPAGRGQPPLLDWATASKLPWGILLLVGGGLSLAASIQDSGLAAWIGARLEVLGVLPTVLIVLAVIAGIMILSELTSNTATAATFLPVAATLAIALGLNPALLAVPVALAASSAFMLPVATPPNALAYSTGRVTAGQMVRGGVLLSGLFLLLNTVLAYLLVPIVLPGP